MDLAGDLAAGEALLAGAEAVSGDPEIPARELLTAAHGAEEAFRLLAARLAYRRASIDAASRALGAEADALAACLEGQAMLDLPDQQGAIGRLLGRERGQMRALIDSHVRAPAAALRRWNGHAARTARIAAVADLFRGEILRARRALGGALAHEEKRYLLEHIWRDLVLDFGEIADLGPATAGVWADPDDPKSTYVYMLRSPRGEVLVEVPWSGEIVVRHERLRQRYPLFVEPSPEALAVGALSARWRQLGVRLANPHWDPGTVLLGGD
jgi:hypothetical protein